MDSVLQTVAEDGDQGVGTSTDARKKGSGMVATAEEQSRRDAMDMRCLSLCIGMLERVNGVGCYCSRSCSDLTQFIFLDVRGEFNSGRGSE